MSRSRISMRSLVTASLVAVLAVTLFAGVALGKQPSVAERGNALASQATQVELTEDDVRFVQFGDVSYVAIDHNLGGWDNLVWREPARLGGQNNVSGPDSFNTLYLGVAGPDGGGVAHKGQVSVYYEINGEWSSIIAQFDGKGELVHVNGVAPGN
ncbi:MAG: hypothetical protein EA415_11750 [Sphaerobacteraceae bacterium]|nr:MAG: hypothetical protein EA415_11750 [Sphaerobacteraceae bacterium]